MGYHPMTKSREYRQGWLGRRRNYVCRECGEGFQVDTLNALPGIDRVCQICRLQTGIYTFVDKLTGKETKIRASDSELATLRSWAINPNLTYKVII